MYALKKELLNRIYKVSDRGQKYIILNHADKTWIAPVSKVKIALDMYQPSTIKGKLLKKLIILFKGNRFILNKLGAEIKELAINEEIIDYIDKVTGKKNYYVAGYMGDTSSRQNNKVTLQVYDEGCLICFIKLTEDLKIQETFHHEIEALKYLNEKKIGNIPEILGISEINGMHIFVQSTNKKVHEKVKLIFGKIQLEAINKMVDATKLKCRYEETDFYQTVTYLKQNTGDYTVEQQSVLKETIFIVEEKLNNKIGTYAFSHGDYTPWNVYYKNNNLYIFDFEYCNYTMPEYIDVFHYITQMLMLGKKSEIGMLVHKYKSYRKLLEKYIVDVDFTYLCYLIWIVGFYHRRAADKSKIAEGQNVQRIELMKYLNEKVGKR